MSFRVPRLLAYGAAPRFSPHVVAQYARRFHAAHGVPIRPDVARSLPQNRVNTGVAARMERSEKRRSVPRMERSEKRPPHKKWAECIDVCAYPVQTLLKAIKAAYKGDALLQTHF